MLAYHRASLLPQLWYGLSRCGANCIVGCRLSLKVRDHILNHFGTKIIYWCLMDKLLLFWTRFESLLIGVSAIVDNTILIFWSMIVYFASLFWPVFVVFQYDSNSGTEANLFTSSNITSLPRFLGATSSCTSFSSGCTSCRAGLRNFGPGGHFSSGPPLISIYWV